MENNSKLQIYKGMIQYLLDSTHYTLKHIAELSSASIKNSLSLYRGNHIPIDFTLELALTNLYLIILETNLSRSHVSQYFLMQPSHKQTGLITLEENNGVI